MKPMENQQDLAASIIRGLSDSNLFSSVTLTGSLAAGHWDALSDIDITLSSASTSPVQTITNALNIISKIHAVRFSDWARSLLPDKCVLSVFLRRFPAFWYIDLSVYHAPPWPAMKREDFQRDPVHHIFKLWICNAKQQLRSNPEKNLVHIMYDRLFDDSHQGMSNIFKFRKTLDWLVKNSPDAELLSACRDIMARMEAAVQP